MIRLISKALVCPLKYDLFLGDNIINIISTFLQDIWQLINIQYIIDSIISMLTHIHRNMQTDCILQ